MKSQIGFEQKALWILVIPPKRRPAEQFKVAEAGSVNGVEFCAVINLPMFRSKITSRVQFQAEAGWRHVGAFQWCTFDSPLCFLQETKLQDVKYRFVIDMSSLK